MIKLVLRTMIVLSLILVALAISWYPWRDPEVDTGTGQPSGIPDPAPIEPQPDVTAAPSPPAASAPPSPPAADGKPVMSAPDRALADEVIRLVNAERAKAKCAAAKPDGRLTTAALTHSDEMARLGYLSHTGQDGTDPSRRARAAGYPAAASENIAVGYPDAKSVMNSWLASPGHRGTIVNCKTKSLGVGLVRNAAGTPYWTQLLGT